VEAEFVFYHSLTLAAAFASTDDAGRRKLRALLRSNQKKMKRWARHCPENFLHKWRLVAAEQARLEGDSNRAMQLYDEAIEDARKQEYFQNEALGNELAGRFYEGLGREKVARAYLWDARQGYAAWGAAAKVRQMDNAYGWLFTHGHHVTSVPGTAREPSTVTESAPGSLDLLSVLKASQALSGEIEFSRFLQTMMTIVLENAGAQRGALVMERGAALVVEAEHDLGMAAPVVMHSLPLEQCQNVCEGIIRYVARSHQTVVLHNAEVDGDFVGDPYILRVRPRSVLSMPIEHQGRLTGILYLENNLVSNAFTPARLEVLRLLSSQIAVSMENARLYVQERELARMQEEVRLAAVIQRDLLPTHPPVLAGYEILGRNIPAQTVGGDYFDFIRIVDERLAITLGDVSGKGLPASLLMANLQAALRGQTLHDLSPAECLARSNRLLYESTSPEKFATVFYAILDVRTHTLHCCNGGHEHPLLVSTDGTLRTLEAGGTALGFLPEFKYEEEAVPLAGGDLLLIYSDGIPEAMNPHGVQFGHKKLTEILQEHKGLPLQDLLDVIVGRVHAHAAGAPQSDDITLVAVRRSLAKPPSDNHHGLLQNPSGT
jgi:serine phosphatase RsbU (regulator of sigma subunit)